MTWEEYVIETNDNKSAMHALVHAMKYVDYLKATIEAQEIIIKDKSSIMEAMAQYKTCEGCMYNRFGCDSLGYAVDCTIQFKICSRACDDCYEPKAQP